MFFQATSNPNRNSQKIGTKFSGVMRGVAAAFASDFDVFLKAEKTHIQNTERHFQEQKNVTRDFRTWAEKKEDDIRIIASRTAAIEDALAAREALLVHELSAARTTLKEIKHRSKTIDEAQQSLAQLIKKRDSINRNESELEHWRHEARKADQHLKLLQAAHSGATRRDLQSAFIRKHEAIIKYTDVMRTASQFAIHMWNQLPQGELRPGQDIPAFTAEQLETLHRIMNDFEKALGVVEANRINTSTTAAASVNTAAPSRLSSLAPPTYTSTFTQSTGDTDTSYTLDDSFSFATSHNANLDNASTSEFSISTVTPTAIQRDSVSQIQRGAQGVIQPQPVQGHHQRPHSTASISQQQLQPSLSPAPSAFQLHQNAPSIQEPPQNTHSYPQLVSNSSHTSQSRTPLNPYLPNNNLQRPSSPLQPQTVLPYSSYAQPPNQRALTPTASSPTQHSRTNPSVVVPQLSQSQILLQQQMTAQYPETTQLHTSSTPLKPYIPLDQDPSTPLSPSAHPFTIIHPPTPPTTADRIPSQHLYPPKPLPEEDQWDVLSISSTQSTSPTTPQQQQHQPHQQQHQPRPLSPLKKEKLD